MIGYFTTTLAQLETVSTASTAETALMDAFLQCFCCFKVTCGIYSEESLHDLSPWDLSLKDGFRLQSEVREGALLHPKGKKKDVGALIFESVRVEKTHSFCDFLMGGCEVSLMAAIDFTASNGDPREYTHTPRLPFLDARGCS